MAIETLEEDDNVRKENGRVANKSSVQNHPVNKHAPEGEWMTLTRDDNAAVDPIRDGQYNIDLQSQITVLQKSADGVNRDETGTCHVHIHVKTHVSNIKASCGGSNKTIKPGYGGHLAPIGENNNTCYGGEKRFSIETKSHTTHL